MQEVTKRHSMLGVISCAIGCLTFFIFLLATAFYYLQFQNIAAASTDEGWQVLQMSAVLILPVPVHIFCLILAAVALFFPNRKKLFPILGAALNLIFAVISLFPWLWVIIAGAGRV